MKQISKS